MCQGREQGTRQRTRPDCHPWCKSKERERQRWCGWGSRSVSGPFQAFPRVLHAQSRLAVNETTALAGFSPGGRWAALHISSWPRPLQGTQERTSVVPHRAVGLGAVAGRILSHLPLESTDSSFSSDRDFFPENLCILLVTMTC